MVLYDDFLGHLEEYSEGVNFSLPMIDSGIGEWGQYSEREGQSKEGADDGASEKGVRRGWG